jgi:hypothetical protein
MRAVTEAYKRRMWDGLGWLLANAVPTEGTETEDGRDAAPVPPLGPLDVSAFRRPLSKRPPEAAELPPSP